MNHAAVGEALSGDYSHTARAARLAAEDAARSEWLAQRVRIVTREDSLDPVVCETDGCGAVLHENAKGTKCPRCLNRDWMRQARGGYRGGSGGGKRGVERARVMVPCEACKTPIQKWNGANVRRFCEECRPAARAAAISAAKRRLTLVRP